MIRPFLVIANRITGGLTVFVFFATASDYRFRGCLEAEAWQCSDARTTMWVAGLLAVVLWASAFFIWRRRRGYA